MSESSLSHRLKSLEDALTVSLFHRSSEGVTPTHAGLIFFEQAREALRILDLAAANAAAISQGVAGRLTIGLYTSLSTGRLHDALAAFRATHPDLDLHLVEGGRSQMIEGLSSRAIDLTVLIGPPDINLGEALPLWRERMHIAVPIHHPFASRARVQWHDLGSETVLISTRGAGPEALCLLASKLGESARRTSTRSHFISRETVLAMVGMGFGVSLMIESDLGRQPETVVTVPIDGDDEDDGYVALTAYRDPRNDNPPLRRFWSLLKASYASVG
jgi:DNA-binding transcriptional LysR family regulator